MTSREARELWAQALESGDYKQGVGRLTKVVDGEELDCCLGVGCKLAVRHGVIVEYDGEESDLFIYPAVRRWLGLSSSVGMYRDGSCVMSLIGDNDSGSTFPEIAARIRAEPDGLVLDEEHDAEWTLTILEPHPMPYVNYARKHG